MLANGLASCPDNERRVLRNIMYQLNVKYETMFLTSLPYCSTKLLCIIYPSSLQPISSVVLHEYCLIFTSTDT